jgi:hypothetical protein
MDTDKRREFEVLQKKFSVDESSSAWINLNRYRKLPPINVCAIVGSV